MSLFTRVEEIQAWKESMGLAESVYRAVRDNKTFSSDFGLRDQAQRAVVSIPSNIAEGYERGTTPEFIRFLSIAKGSCAELRTQLEIAFRLEYVSQNDFNSLHQKSLQVSGMIGSLISSLRKRKD